MIPFAEQSRKEKPLKIACGEGGILLQRRMSLQLRTLDTSLPSMTV